MDDLVAFLRARLDEDERIARHATDGPWVDPLGGPIRGGFEERFVIAQQAQRWNSQHIARHDPARVLAEVDVKRQILEKVGPRMNEMDDQIDGEWGVGEGPSEYESVTLFRLLALPYADHPDYRPEWRP